MGFDLTTINRSRLESLPLAVLPPTYRLQAGCGNGCYLDPPGFPSYFTRHVYTPEENAERWAAWQYRCRCRDGVP
jgi:hypothetical protein